MTIGVLEVEMRIPDATSLKIKRMVVKSIKDRIGNKFNVSVSEISHLSNRKNCVLGVAHLSNAKSFTNHVLSDVLNFIQSCRQVEVTDFRISMF